MRYYVISIYINVAQLYQIRRTMTWAIVNESEDTLNTLLKAGVDPNQHCSLIVGAFAVWYGSFAVLCDVTAVHEDNTCDIADSISGKVHTRLAFNDVESGCVSLLSCAVLSACSGTTTELTEKVMHCYLSCTTLLSICY